MDINSLLSPSESPVAETPPPLASPSPRSSPNKKRAVGRPASQQRKSSGLSQQLTLDDSRSSEQSLPSLAAHNAATAYHHQHQGAYSHATQGASLQHQSYGGASSTPESRASSTLPPLHRQGSTAGMDTLAGMFSHELFSHDVMWRICRNLSKELRDKI
jgi:hypothetical protein